MTAQVLTAWKIEAENGIFERFEVAGTSKQVAGKVFRKQFPDAGKILKIEQINGVEPAEEAHTNGNGNTSEKVVPAVETETKEKDRKEEHPATLHDLIELSKNQSVNTLLSNVIYGATIAVVGQKIPSVGDMKQASHTGNLYINIRKKLMFLGYLTLETVMIDPDFVAMLISDGFLKEDAEAIAKEVSKVWCHQAKLDTLKASEDRKNKKAREALERSAKYR